MSMILKIIPGLILLLLFTNNSDAQLRNKNLLSITFWERTGNGLPVVSDPKTFSPESRELITKTSERLNYKNADFSGWMESYDVFYSDESGNFDIDGNCISIEANFDLTYPPYHGGLNIAEVQLNFLDGSQEYASVVTSYNALGNNAQLDSIKNAADSKLETITWMGNTSNSTEKLRVTVGFKSVVDLNESDKLYFTTRISTLRF